jgi:hypothetical protein
MDWQVVDHPNMPGFTIYSTVLDGYFYDTDGEEIWFPSKAEAQAYIKSGVHRG